jgi:hypothetical protein
MQPSCMTATQDHDVYLPGQPLCQHHLLLIPPGQGIRLNLEAGYFYVEEVFHFKSVLGDSPIVYQKIFYMFFPGHAKRRTANPLPGLL